MSHPSDEPAPKRLKTDILSFIAEACSGGGYVACRYNRPVLSENDKNVDGVRRLIYLVDTKFNDNNDCTMTFYNSIITMTFSKAYGKIHNVKVAEGPEVSYDDIKAYLMKITS